MVRLTHSLSKELVIFLIYVVRITHSTGRKSHTLSIVAHHTRKK